MSEHEPKRLMEADSGAPESLRTLFAAGAADLPSSAELARVAAKLGPVLAPPGAPASSGLATAAKVGLAALVVGGGALLLSSLDSREPEPSPPVPSEVRSVPPAPPSPAEVTASAPAQVAPAPESAAVDASGQAPPAAKTGPSQPVESEAAFLERARATLATSPARALALANLHRSRYPSGVLAQEREVIAIEALKRLGRGDEAARRSGDFSNRYPGSAYGRKLDASTGK
jgi:hypothetical protein